MAACFLAASFLAAPFFAERFLVARFFAACFLAACFFAPRFSARVPLASARHCCSTSARMTKVVPAGGWSKKNVQPVWRAAKRAEPA